MANIDRLLLVQLLLVVFGGRSFGKTNSDRSRSLFRMALACDFQPIGETDSLSERKGGLTLWRGQICFVCRIGMLICMLQLQCVSVYILHPLNAMALYSRPQTNVNANDRSSEIERIERIETATVSARRVSL